jgi:AraC-like DNA-binding protein
MKYSRSQLYNKVKEICNCTPADFIRNQRLEYAARLIDEGELTISEIVYKVGMKYPAYFYKLFKEKYGVSPSQYAKGERK